MNNKQIDLRLRQFKIFVTNPENWDAWLRREDKVLKYKAGAKDLFLDGCRSNPKELFRVTFQIRITMVESIGYLDLAIYNLKDKYELKVGQKITLEAGYQGDQYGVIFVGRITALNVERDGPDLVTRAWCISDFSGARLSFSMGKNSTVKDLLDTLKSKTGFDLVMDDDTLKDQKAFLRGYEVSGDLKHELDRLRQQTDLDWSIDQGKLRISRKGLEKRTNTPIEISPEKGQIGIPEFSSDQLGLYVQCETRLNPKIRPQSHIKVNSTYCTYTSGEAIYYAPGNAEVNGEYWVQELEFSGDSWGNDWKTSMKAFRSSKGVSGSEKMRNEASK